MSLMAMMFVAAIKLVGIVVICLAAMVVAMAWQKWNAADAGAAN